MMLPVVNRFYRMPVDGGQKSGGRLCAMGGSWACMMATASQTAVKAASAAGSGSRPSCDAASRSTSDSVHRSSSRYASVCQQG